ncbi:hypothetical protein KP004_18795 [Geomonas oryzisoli]|uniref:DUF3304 domain-containing protein n=1 Tax=Geomonas oryzisoli TaxID=2847992 RepID=A0ABX8J7T0_9BACT|nr:hypothetical protein [Geomonas oryzisoli]QWV93191.1 hypothetical protein KP004_18795 [Geomonas oryzisoli]
MLRRLLYYAMIGITGLLSMFAVADAGDANFVDVKDDTCVVLSDGELRLLPAKWHKYRGFVKTCGLTKSKGSDATISMVSIWSHEYLDANRKQTWEEFPLPILVDHQFRQCGTLPELYPASYVNSVYVRYGKWKSGIPTEIRVDVADPTVSGDYHYAPLKWDDSDRKYKIPTTRPLSGHRRVK